MIELTLAQLAGVVVIAVGLAVTDGASISHLFVAYAAKKAGLKPSEITRYEKATDDDGSNDPA